MQVRRRADDDRVELARTKEVLEVHVDVGHFEPIGKGAGLGAINVAERGHRHAAQLLEHGQVRHLRNRPGAHDSDSEVRFHLPGQVLYPVPRQGARVRSAPG